MMRQFELVERVKKYNPDSDEELLNRAYVFAMQQHSEQKRDSGDPYFTHPLEVAAILTDLQLDDATIAVGLLHDTVEDTGATLLQIEEKFGDDIRQLVDGLTKINRAGKNAGSLESLVQNRNENARKLLLAASKDLRVLLVKLADRLHNMRTLHHVPPEKRRRIARETSEFYAPLAYAVGMFDFFEEMQDIAFSALNPGQYQNICDSLQKFRHNREGEIEQLRQFLGTRLDAQKLDATILAREKRPYSIFTKLKDRSLSFRHLSDIYGFRIILDEVADCYAALGTVHTIWRAVPNRFKDNISTPRSNGYRSLHTTVVDSDGRRMEIQIRTREMDRVAECGVAAHSLYKFGAHRGSTLHMLHDSSAYNAARERIQNLISPDSSENPADRTRLELLKDQIYCFTPGGNLIFLAAGSSAIDFAYAVHTDIGNTCKGCTINGVPRPVGTILENGDEVNIIRSESISVFPEWSDIVKTARARSAIRRAVQEIERRGSETRGRAILSLIARQTGKQLEEDALDAILPFKGCPSREALYVALDTGKVKPGDVFGRIWPADVALPEAELPMADADGWFTIPGHEDMKFKLSNQHIKSDAPGKPAKDESKPITKLPVSLALRGGPLPGERIVGVITPRQELVIYPIHARDLRRYEEHLDRWVDVSWDPPSDRVALYTTSLRVIASNKPGTLGSVCTIIGDQGANITKIHSSIIEGELCELQLELGVTGLAQLNTILKQLNLRREVNQARRDFGI